MRGLPNALILCMGVARSLRPVDLSKGAAVVDVAPVGAEASEWAPTNQEEGQRAA